MAIALTRRATTCPKGLDASLEASPRHGAEVLSDGRFAQYRHGIVHVAGDPNLSPDEEKDLRRTLVQKALDALESEPAG